MNALALVIGNNNYQYTTKLDNAVNDAKSISDALVRLGYHVDFISDCTQRDFGLKIAEFSEKLKSYDIGLFFYSGHGLQIEGKNYLTGIDTDFNDAEPAKYTSILLDEILKSMQASELKIKIVILDACRDNPFTDKYRGVSNNGLAPVYAPKGSIIAFSTSPGERAKDAGGNNHSIYTASILKHIEDKNIPIEDFFKRVRTSVFTLSGGKQLSWEHTSLIGDYYFNSGLLIQSVDLPYTTDVVADSNFISKGSKAEIIIEKLGTIDWYVQKPAFHDFKNLRPETIDNNIQFLLGRNILQVATGGEYSALDYFDNLGRNIEKWKINGENHLLNGILYEIYFDSNGRLRQGFNFKSSLLDKVCLLEEDERYKSSFDFINHLLQPLKDYLFYIPSSRPVNLPLELTFSKHIVDEFGHEVIYFKLDSIKYQDNDILSVKEGTYYTDYAFENFIQELCLTLSIPSYRLTLSNNFDGEIKYVKVPWILRNSLL